TSHILCQSHKHERMHSELPPFPTRRSSDLAGKQLVPELLQDAATAEDMSAAVMHYFENPEETQALRDTFYAMHQSLKLNASDRAAEAVAQLIHSSAGSFKGNEP